MQVSGLPLTDLAAFHHPAVLVMYLFILASLLLLKIQLHMTGKNPTRTMAIKQQEAAI